jgi:hypothetical protein
MNEITEDLLRFKEAIRHLWNAYFAEVPELNSSQLWVAFETIERELLRSLVLLPRGIPHLAENYRISPLPITLRAKTGHDEIPVQVGSIYQKHNVLWELPHTIPAAELSQLRFIEFFDWNPWGRVDLGYVKGQTQEGRLALVEQKYCDFFFDSSTHPADVSSPLP